MLVFEHGDGEIEDLERFARTLIIPGFLSLETVLDYVGDWVADADWIPRADAEAATRAIWDARVAEQQQWTEPGDYHRLARAYADLEQQGILGRMNFACCKTCATAEIDDERTEHPNPPDWYRYREWAYVYFHQQDADRLADDNPELWFGYSAFRAHPDTPEALLSAASAGDPAAEKQIVHDTESEVGRQVVDAFRRHGLDADWHGDPTTRIRVPIPNWRKPLPQYDD